MIYKKISLIKLLFFSCLFFTTTLADSFNVIHYKIELDLIHSILNQNRFFTGKVTTTIKVDTLLLNELKFHSTGLIIDSVKIGDDKTNFQIIPNFLIIPLNGTYSFGEEIKVTTFYTHPDSTNINFFGGYKIALPGSSVEQFTAFVVGVPFYARTWFPCKEDPSDKALTDIIIKAPADYIAVSNGTLIEKIEENNAAIFNWKENNPIWTATIFFAVSKYTVIKKEFQIGNKNISLEFYVWPVNGNINFNPDENFEKISEMIKFYSTIYSEY